MSTETANDHHHHHRRRDRSILAFFATSLASRGIGIGCQLLQVPIALNHLGNEAFGLWMTLNSIGLMLTFADFGTGLGVQNQVAEALGRNDAGRARRVCFTGLGFLLGMTGLLLLVVTPVCWLTDWRGVFRLTDPAVIADARLIVGITLGSWCLGLPLGLGQRVAYGTQLGWLHNAYDSVKNLVLLLAVFTAANLGAGLAGLIGVSAVVGLVMHGGFLVYVLGRLGWLRGASLAWFDRTVLRGLVNVGVFFSLQQISSLVLFSAPPLILSATLGVAAVTPFNLAQRAFSPFLLIANAYLLPTWPAYTEAKARGDWAWIRRTLRRSLGVAVLLTVVPMAVATCFLREIIVLWAGPKALLPTMGLLWWLFAWNAVTVLQQPFGYFLAGVSALKRSTLYSLLTTVCSLTAMVLLAPHWGPMGVVLGLIGGFVPFVLVGTILESLRVLRAARVDAETAAVPLPVADASATKTKPVDEPELVAAG